MATHEPIARDAAPTPREAELIRRHIIPDPSGFEVADARLREFGTPVWALVAYLDVAQGDPERVAHDYALPREAVEAALAYYRQHRAAIDARVLLNRV